MKIKKAAMELAEAMTEANIIKKDKVEICAENIYEILTSNEYNF